MERIEALQNTSMSWAVRGSGRGDSRDAGVLARYGGQITKFSVCFMTTVFTRSSASRFTRGDGYRIISLPTAPPQTKYPFLYSYLLSWIWVFSRIFPQNILALKTLNLGILSTSLSCFQYRGNRLRPSRLHQPDCFYVYGLCRQ
jgi:hypothetical protein